MLLFFLFKQKTAYEMRISDWSSDVCSSDLLGATGTGKKPRFGKRQEIGPQDHGIDPSLVDERALNVVHTLKQSGFQAYIVGGAVRDQIGRASCRESVCQYV